MPNRSRRSAEDRAEARRRSRQAARGLDTDEQNDEDQEAPAAKAGAAGGSFLTRLFPPAPPIPGKGDPLAGFTYEGPMRGWVAGLYLLAHNPVPWLGIAAVWTVGRLLTTATPLGIIATLVSFGAVILAGWIGWQRPWLFGLVASVVGMAVYSLIMAILLPQFTTKYGSPPGVWVYFMAYETLSFQPLFGIIAGWYGGYLRRRAASTPRSDANARGGRRKR
jgi:hypothetical protein